VSPRRILITGATGGLGHALVREALARGHSVLATGRSREIGKRFEALGASYAALDLADPGTELRGLVASCESVIHAAALSASWGPAEAFETANVTVTQRLLGAAGAAGAARFVFVSSPSIFARFADHIAIRETDPPAPEPLNHYARTKFAAEQAVLSGRSDAMACCAVRPRALVGPGDRVILPRLAALARRKRMPLPRGGGALIELTDLRDAAWAISEAEERAPAMAGKAVNISGGHPVSVRQVAIQLAAALGRNPQLVSLPIAIAKPVAGLLEAVARLRGTSEEPVLTRYTLATLAWSQTFDLEPARRLLGYAPRHDALETLLSEARNLTQTEGLA
jgi:nucleoside-diphosphate-sugar epimerase